MPDVVLGASHRTIAGLLINKGVRDTTFLQKRFKTVFSNREIISQLLEPQEYPASDK
jgi:hypothetical protein